MAGGSAVPCSDDGERRPHKTAARQRPPLRERIVSVQAERGSDDCQRIRVSGPSILSRPRRRCTTQLELPAPLLLSRYAVARVTRAVAQTPEVSVVWE